MLADARETVCAGFREFIEAIECVRCLTCRSEDRVFVQRERELNYSA